MDSKRKVYGKKKAPASKPAHRVSKPVNPVADMVKGTVFEDTAVARYAEAKPMQAALIALAVSVWASRVAKPRRPMAGLTEFLGMADFGTAGANKWATTAKPGMRKAA